MCVCTEVHVINCMCLYYVYTYPFSCIRLFESAFVI